jgi:hypothetical protein
MHYDLTTMYMCAYAHVNRRKNTHLYDILHVLANQLILNNLCNKIMDNKVLIST